MVAVVCLGGVALMAAGWVAFRRASRRSYVFRLGRRGFWIDGQFYFWGNLVAVTHYAELGILLVKVRRSDEIPLALQVDLSGTRFSRLSALQLRQRFEPNATEVVWKTV